MHSDAVTRDLSAIWPLVITAAFLVSGYMRRVSSRTWLLIFSGVFSAVIIAILGQFAPVYEARYFMAAAAPFTILFARFLAELRRPAVQIVCALLIVVSLAAYVDQSYNPDSIVKWDNREAAASLAANYQQGDVIVLVPFYASSIFEYYLPRDVFFAIRGVPLFSINGKPRNTQPQLGEDLSAQIGTAQRVWLVSSFYENPPIERDRKNVALWLESHGFKRVSQQDLRRVRIALYETSQTIPFFYSGGGQ
jgi:hypothetical protein